MCWRRNITRYQRLIMDQVHRIIKAADAAGVRAVAPVVGADTLHGSGTDLMLVLEAQVVDLEAVVEITQALQVLPPWAKRR